MNAWHVLVVTTLLVLGGCGPLARAPGWRGLTVGDLHACALRGRSLYCWGENDLGALGVGALRGHRYLLMDVPRRRYPTRVAGRGWTDVRAVAETTCGVRRGRLYCWGDGSSVEALIGKEWEVLRHPVRIGERQDWRTAYATWEGSCGLRRDGALLCATPGTYDNPGALTRLGQSTAWSRLVPGDWRSGGILRGRVWLWDTAMMGEIVEVPGERPWQDLAIGGAHACGIQDDGALYCWGHNEHGQLGDGTTTQQALPRRVEGAGWTDVAAAGERTCGIRQGSLYCWGITAFRRAEDFSASPPHPFTATPQRVDTRRDWTAVEASADITCGLRAGGELACREEAGFRVGADGQPLDPQHLVPLPFMPPGARKYDF